MKVILDTDIGNDIDDALALSYLLRQPECELIGIVTSCGCAQTHAKIASAVCCAAGRKDIPIFAGTNDCIIIEQKEKYVPHATVLDHWEHHDSYEPNQALDFIRKAVRQYPNEIVFLEIAPPSNLARLFLVDPEAATLLKGVVMMGGKFGEGNQKNWTQHDPAKRRTFSVFEPNQIDEILIGGALEPNACIDPYATAVAYQIPLPLHSSVGVDCTSQVVMSSKDFNEVLSQNDEDRLHRLLLEMGNMFLSEIPYVTFHDPLPTVTLFNDSVCKFTRGNVEVELQSNRLLGYTYFEEDVNGKHEVASSVNPQEFFKEFFSIV